MSFERPFEDFDFQEDEEAVEQPSAAQHREEVMTQSEVQATEVGGFEREFSWKSEIATVDAAELAVKESLEALHWPQDDIDTFSLAVREAVANAVIHGNLGVAREKGESLEAYDARKRDAEQGVAREKEVGVRIFAGPNRVSVTVKDQGNFIPDLQKVLAPGEPGEAPELEPSGRGLKIIFDYCTRVEAAPGELALIKERSSDESPESLVRF